MVFTHTYDTLLTNANRRNQWTTNGATSVLR